MKLRPKNWSNFQHYKKRTPPWIKLHRTLLDDFHYQRLPVASKALAPMLWLVASEYDDGIFEASAELLAFRLRWDVKDIESGLNPLISAGFFVDASKTLAQCLHDATLETEREAEKEAKKEEQKQPKPKRFVPPTPDEVKAYCRERNNRVDAERFVDFYASKGWMVGKTKMRDWKASVRTWERSEAPAEPKRPQHRELT